MKPTFAGTDEHAGTDELDTRRGETYEYEQAT